jgi:hypothetical protein
MQITQFNKIKIISGQLRLKHIRNNIVLQSSQWTTLKRITLSLENNMQSFKPFCAFRLGQIVSASANLPMARYSLPRLSSLFHHAISYKVASLWRKIIISPINTILLQIDQLVLDGIIDSFFINLIANTQLVLRQTGESARSYCIFERCSFRKLSIIRRRRRPLKYRQQLQTRPTASTERLP